MVTTVLEIQLQEIDLPEEQEHNYVAKAMIFVLSVSLVVVNILLKEVDLQWISIGVTFSTLEETNVMEVHILNLIKIQAALNFVVWLQLLSLFEGINLLYDLFIFNSRLLS